VIDIRLQASSKCLLARCRTDDDDSKQKDCEAGGGELEFDVRHDLGSAFVFRRILEGVAERGCSLRNRHIRLADILSRGSTRSLPTDQEQKRGSSIRKQTHTMRRSPSSWVGPSPSGGAVLGSHIKLNGDYKVAIGS
jgi:hypothetical protein